MNAVQRFLGSLLFLGLAVLSLAAPVLAAPAQNVVVSVIPSTTSPKVDDTVTAEFKVNSSGQALTTIRIVVDHSSNLQFVSFDATGSVFSSELTTPSSSSGSFVVERITFSPFNGSAGLMFKVTFKATATGSASMSINSTATAIYEETEGNVNVYGSSINSSFTINEASASPASDTSTPAPTASTSTATPKATTSPKSTAKPTAKATTTPLASATPTPTETPIPLPTEDLAALITTTEEPTTLSSNVKTARTLGLSSGVGLMVLALLALWRFWIAIHHLPNQFEPKDPIQPPKNDTPPSL